MQLNLENISRISFHRRTRIAMHCVIWTIVSTLVIRIMDPSYKSSVTVLVKPPDLSPLEALEGMSTGIFRGMIGGERETVIASQKLLLESQRLYRSVIERVPEYLQVYKEDRSKDFNHVATRINAAIFGEKHNKNQDFDTAPGFLDYQKRLTFTPDLDSGSFVIEFKAKDPQLSIKMTDAIVQSLITINNDMSNIQVDRSITFLKKRLDDAQQELREISSQIASFVKQHKVISNHEFINTRFQYYVESDTELRRRTGELSSLEKMQKNAEQSFSKLNDEAKTALQSGRDAEIEALTHSMRDIASALSARTSYSDSPAVLSLQTSLKSLQEKLRDVTKTSSSLLDLESYKTLMTDLKKELESNHLRAILESERIKALRANMESLTEELEALPGLVEILNQKLATQERARRMVETLEIAMITIQIKGDGKSMGFVPIESPHLLTGLSKDDKFVKMLLLTLLGYILIIGFTIRKEVMKGLIVDKAQLQDLRETPVAACIQHIDTRNSTSIEQHISTSESCFRAGFGVIRTLFRNEIKGKIVGVFSALPNEGKSFVSKVIAISAAAKIPKVLHIDCDIRGHYANKKIKKSSKGSECLLSTQQILDNISKYTTQHTAKTPMFSYLDIEETNSEQEIMFLFEEKISQQLKSLRNHFNLIVIDTSPLSFPEVTSLIEEVDGHVICSREGTSCMSSVEFALSTITQHRRDDVPSCIVMSDSRDHLHNENTLRIYYPTRKKASGE